MVYEKRLLILSGGNANGCLRLERTASGIACCLTGNTRGECVLVVRDDVNVLNFGGVMFPSAYRFTLPLSTRIDALVVSVGDLDGKLVMCGGFRRPMPWRSNLEDDIARALRALGARREKATPPPSQRNIEDFFLDIVPTDYDDTRVAEVNYYRSNMTSFEPPEAGETPPSPRPEPVREPEPRREPVREPSSFPPQFLDREEQPAVVAEEAKPTSEELPTEKAATPEEEPKTKIAAERREESTEPLAAEQTTAAPTPNRAESAQSEPSAENDASPAPQTKLPPNEEEEIASTVLEPPVPQREEPPVEARENKIPELSPVSFYESIRDQIERLFSKNERFPALEKLLPESRWIKVNYDGRGRYYLVGVIGDPVRYLCYGVPGEYSPTPPPDLVGYCQWLASDEKDPAGKGFWLMYQDGRTGKSVL